MPSTRIHMGASKFTLTTLLDHREQTLDLRLASDDDLSCAAHYVNELHGIKWAPRAPVKRIVERVRRAHEQQQREASRRDHARMEVAA